MISQRAYHYAFVSPALLLSIGIVLVPALLTFAVAFMLASSALCVAVLGRGHRPLPHM